MNDFKTPYLMNLFFYFFSLKMKKKLLNGHWNVPSIQQNSVGLNVDWKVTEQCVKSGFQWTFCEPSVDIQTYQLTERRIFILCTNQNYYFPCSLGFLISINFGIWIKLRGKFMFINEVEKNINQSGEWQTNKSYYIARL